MPSNEITTLSHKKLKILLVEDSVIDAEIIERELKKSELDFEIRIVHTKTDYKKSVNEHPDIILCDHSLPEFNSIEALEYLHKNNLKIPFILITGAITEELSIQIIKKGGSDYILKDRITRLPSAITNALEKFRIQNELDAFISENISNDNNSNDKTVLASLELGSIIDSSPSHTALLDNKGNIIAVNKSWKEFAVQNELNDYNYGLGKNYIEISNNAIGSDKKTGVEAAAGIKNILSGKLKEFSLEYPCDSPNEKRWFRLLATPLKIGDSSGAVVMHLNVSEVKFVEEELFRTEKKFQALVENSGDIIALINKEGIIEYISPSIKRILGYDPEELIGKNFVFGMHPDDVEKKEDNFDKLLSDPDTPIHSIHRVQHKDGSYKWLEGVKINRLNDENVRAIVANFRDITERKEAEIKISNANRLYSFLSHINQSFVHNDTEEKLFNDVCRIAINQGKLKMAWIGLYDKENSTLKMAAQSGASERMQSILKEYKYIKGGPLHKVLNGAGYFVINDVEKDSKSAWESFGKEEEYRSAISLPIKKMGEVIGTYSLYYSELNYFDETEIKLLLEAAGDISFALDVMEKKRLHKIAEKKVAESEKKYKGLFNQSPLPMWVYDSEKFRYLDVNEAAISHYGYSREEFLSMSVVDIRPEEDKEKFIKSARSSKQDIHTAGVWRHIKKDGSLIDVEITVDYIIFNGVPARLALVRDVTEKLRMDKIIEQSEKTLKAAQAIAHVGSYEVDLTTGISIWSEECCRIYGISPKNNIQTFEYWKSFVHPEDMEFVLKTFDEVEASITSVSLHFRITRPDGAVRCLLTQLLFTLNEAGAMTNITGVVHDITERLIIEQEKEFTKNNLESLINSTKELMWSVDTDFKMITSNLRNDEALEKFFGKKIEIGQNIFDVINDEKTQKEHKEYYKRAFSGEIFTVVEHIEGPFSIWMEISFYPMRDEGKIIGTACYGKDITQRRQAEEEREKLINDIFQRNKNLEQFTYIISHNLRAPVANILGFAEELSEEINSEEDKKIFLMELLNGVKRLDEIIADLNQILHLNKDDDSQKEEVFLSQLVHSIKSSIVNILNKEEVEIKTNFQNVKMLYCNKNYIYSIFYNLIINSIKYKKPDIKPLIEISSEKKDGKILLAFKDNGRGIDLEKKGALVFGLYKRFHPEIEGKGMGLFMVKSQVENLGGKISINSSLETGTVFELEFPETINFLHK